ncbi:UNVERIFIED_CONTAM: hypothetical protein Sindi_2279500 [Sesamum indicum]
MLVTSGVASYKVFRSCTKEGDLDVVRVRFMTLDDFLIQVPTLFEHPHSGLCRLLCGTVGSGVTVSHTFFSKVFTLFEIPLDQLAPKAFSIFAGFCILVSILGETPSAAQFHSFFILKKASPRLFYFTSRGDAHFLSSDSFVKEWKRHYFFVSSPTPWVFPTEWVPIAPDSPRYYNRMHPAAIQALLERLNTFHFDPCELIHPALLFHYRLSPKEVVLDTAAVNMFNKLLQDKALSEGKNLEIGSSSKHSLVKSPCSIPASLVLTDDRKGKCYVQPMSPPANKAKVSSDPFAHLALKPATCIGTLRMAWYGPRKR